MRKPCWGWNDPSIEEAKMAAFPARVSLCWLVGLMLSRLSRAGRLMVDHQGSTSSPLTLHLAHLRGAEIWNQNLKENWESEQTKHARSNSSTLMYSLSHTRKLQTRALRRCSGYICRWNASQHSPAQKSVLILPASIALLCSCWMFLCALRLKKRALSLCLKICLGFCTKLRFLLSDATEWKTFIFLGRREGPAETRHVPLLSKSVALLGICVFKSISFRRLDVAQKQYSRSVASMETYATVYCARADTSTSHFSNEFLCKQTNEKTLRQAPKVNIIQITKTNL